MNDLALADELRGELRGSAALAGRAAQDERVAAVLDDRVRDRPAIGARHLADRLEPENAASAELTQPRQGVLEAVDLPERVELVDEEPQPLIAFTPAHRFEDRDPQPRGDDRPERRDLSGLVRKEHAAAAARVSRRPVLHPLSDGEGCALL